MTAINLRLGLTGGMGAGKSTIARYFAALGLTIIDADQLTRVVHGDKTVIDQLVLAFGTTILEPNVSTPQISRRNLGICAFSQPSGVEILNEIMRPALRDEAQNQLNRAQKHVILDAPLLLEAGWQDMVDAVMVVLCPQAERITRIMARDHLPITQIEARLLAQMSDLDRIKHADILIYNTGSLAELELQAKFIFEKYLHNVPQASI